jgi:tripartite-type tricarboxylate transporter receptor subunit TctC
MIAAWGTNAVIATPGAKFNSLSELLAQARANPGRITFASAGVGSPSHIALELFQQATDTQFLHVPYKGTGPAVTDLIAGHVQVAFMATHTIMPFVNRGQLKPLAVARSSRHRVAPNVPSFVEEGVKNFVDEGWYGFLMPRGVPTEVQNKLHAEIRSILLLPDVKANLEKIGLDIRPSSIEEMRLWLQKEQADFAAIIRKNGIKGD